MAVTKRKSRGKSREPLYLEVDGVTKTKINDVATALGISKAAALDLILAETPVDANGRPAWWDGPLAVEIDQELPFERAV